MDSTSATSRLNDQLSSENLGALGIEAKKLIAEIRLPLIYCSEWLNVSRRKKMVICCISH